MFSDGGLWSRQRPNLIFRITSSKCISHDYGYCPRWHRKWPTGIYCLCFFLPHQTLFVPLLPLLSFSFSFLRPLQPLTLFFPSRLFWSLCPSVTLQTFVTPLLLFSPQPFFLSLAVFLIFLSLFLTLSTSFHLKKRVSCGPVSLGASRQILISGVSLCPLSVESQ